MSTEIWLKRAERLRWELACVNSELLDGADDSAETRHAAERLTIARWLRAEFSG